MDVRKFFCFLVVVFVVYFTFSAECTEHQKADGGGGGGYVASTIHGRVKGTVRFAVGSNKPVYSFFGIPYARSPDYAFRFRPPIDPWKWDEIKDATDEDVPLCRQDKNKLRKLRENTIKKFFFADDVTMQENCLTLNVFTPNRPHDVTKLPVMVWIHGGSLQTSSTPHQLWMLPGYEEVLLVVIQYRLGALGFMNMNDDNSVANIGLRDQVKSLQWVRDNIGNFGGDRDHVTIIGQSAGGFSTSALMLTPYARGLFHRVVAMSGVAVKPSLWGKSQERNTHKVAEDLGCKLWKNGLTMTCMRNRITSTTLLNSTQDYMFVAQADGDFFPRSPDRLLEERGFDEKIPLMLGGVAGEYDFLLGRKKIRGYKKGGIFTREMAREAMMEEMRKYFPTPSSNSKKLLEMVDYYLDNSATTGHSYHRSIVDFFTDFHFHSQIHKTAEAHRDGGGQVFMYNFGHQPTWYKNSHLDITRAYEYNRADHGDDVPFFLGLPFLQLLRDVGITFTAEERRLSRKLMHAVAIFAETGKPSFGDELEWNQFPSHLSIGNNATLEVFPQPYAINRINMWKNFFKSAPKSPSN